MSDNIVHSYAPYSYNYDNSVRAYSSLCYRSFLWAFEYKQSVEITTCDNCLDEYHWSKSGGKKVAIDELRAKLFVEAKDDANTTILAYRSNLVREHADWSDEQIREATYEYIMQRQAEMRLHIEKMRAKQIAELTLGNELIATLTEERRENLRRLDLQYRPVTNADGSITSVKKSKAKTPEEKAIEQVMSLMKLSREDAEQFVKNPSSFSK